MDKERTISSLYSNRIQILQPPYFRKNFMYYFAKENIFPDSIGHYRHLVSTADVPNVMTTPWQKPVKTREEDNLAKTAHTSRIFLYIKSPSSNISLECQDQSLHRDCWSRVFMWFLTSDRIILNHKNVPHIASVSYHPL